MITIGCVTCRNETSSQLYVWVEPISGENVSPIYFIGTLCEDCRVVHWAGTLEEWSKSDADLGQAIRK